MRTYIHPIVILLVAALFFSCESDPILEDFEIAENTLNIEAVDDEEEELPDTDLSGVDDEEEELPETVLSSVDDEEEELPETKKKKVDDEEEELPESGL